MDFTKQTAHVHVPVGALYRARLNALILLLALEPELLKIKLKIYITKSQKCTKWQSGYRKIKKMRYTRIWILGCKIMNYNWVKMFDF